MNAVECQLCPKQCVLNPGERGDCRIRANLDGTLRALTYGFPSAIHVDPIEKKPFNHFLPGTRALSLGTVGCNLHCANCQNWDLSQREPEDADAMPLPPEQVPVVARQQGCASVAYTYSDPAVFFEYTLDACVRCREAGLRNVLVTAGYLNDAPARELLQHADAATIDIKAFSDAFYRDICGATLEPVLNTVVLARTLGLIVEVSNLVIPTLNDTDADIRALCRWIVEDVGRDTPLHFLRFVPHYRMKHLPPTPPDTLARARAIARAEGLEFVYVGNLLDRDASTTACPSCGKTLVRRTGFILDESQLPANGQCPGCGHGIYGRWN